MRIYIAALLESASHTPIGKSWMLDRNKVMADLAITDARFDQLHAEIERRMAGTWKRAATPDQTVFFYVRLR